MSNKNYIAYGDAETILTEFADDIKNKVDKETGKGLSTNDFTTDEKTKLSGIATGAEVNQNAFTTVKVNNTNLAADSKTDTLTITAGTNITLTPNAANDSFEISAAGGSSITVDSALSSSSTNPVQNKVINSALNNKADTSDIPTKTSDLTNDSNYIVDSNYVHTDNNYTTAEKNKLSGIESGANKTTVDSALSSSSTNPLQNKAINTALSGKVDKVSGKGLSTNDYTTAEKNKLANLAAVAISGSFNDLDDTEDVCIDSNYTHTDNNFTDAEKSKLAGIESGAQVNTITGVKGSNETTYRTGNINITKSNIGLSNVDNTSDANKPISTATQTALNAKANRADLAAVASSGNYNDLSNKPSSLPANGGNADTVESFSASGLLKWYDCSGKNPKADNVIYTGIYKASDWSDIPTDIPDSQGTLIVNNYLHNHIDGTNYGTQRLSGHNWGQQFFTAPNLPGEIFMRSFTAASNNTYTFTDWEKIIHTGNCPIDIDYSYPSSDEYAQNYAKFPNGLTIQWGWGSNIASGDTFTFPYAFSVPPSVSLSRGKMTSVSASAFTYTRDSDDTLDDYTIFWTAIGYIN